MMDLRIIRQLSDILLGTPDIAENDKLIIDIAQRAFINNCDKINYMIFTSIFDIYMRDLAVHKN